MKIQWIPGAVVLVALVAWGVLAALGKTNVAAYVAILGTVVASGLPAVLGKAPPPPSDAPTNPRGRL